MKVGRAVICGQGPSWALVDVQELTRTREAGALVIAVNGAVAHAPADVFFTLDLSPENRRRIANPVPGVRYVVAAPATETNRVGHVTYLRRIERAVSRKGPYAHRAGQEAPGGLSEDPKAINTGNSAFGALNLAYHLGVQRIVLLGVDGCGYTRWDGTRNFCLEHMPALFASAVPQLAAAGIAVVNGSPQSAVECFPRLTPHDALEWLMEGDGPGTGGRTTPRKRRSRRRASTAKGAP